MINGGNSWIFVVLMHLFSMYCSINESYLIKFRKRPEVDSAMGVYSIIWVQNYI